MKKLLQTILCTMLAVSLGGCTGTNSGSHTTPLLKAGTYEGTAAGKNGDITVSITVTADAITDIQVVSQQETAGVADNALSDVPQEIISGQSLNVDTVTGATETSNGIINAVADALTKAGGNQEDWKKEVASTTQTKPEELNTDVIVVGGGMAGMTATLRLRELGVKVVLIEKMTELGGALAMSSGTQIVTGSKVQEKAGEKADTASSLEEDLAKETGSDGRTELLHLFAENVGPVTDWLTDDLGLEYDLKKGFSTVSSYGRQRVLTMSGGGKKIAKILASEVDVSNAKVLLDTRVVQLLTDGSKVSGVVARSAEGKLYLVHADHVILAAGGYGSNDNLMPDQLKSALYYGPAFSTGDAIVLSQDESIAAATVDLADVSWHYGGLNLGDGTALSAEKANREAEKSGLIFVNKEGVRVVNEAGECSTILSAMLKQTDQTLYAVMNQDAYVKWKAEMSSDGLKNSVLKTWLEENGTGSQICVTADSLSKAATAAGIDATALAKTVADYDLSVTEKTDRDFARSADTMTHGITSDGSYYIVAMKPYYSSTLGGLAVNAKLQVLNTSGAVIEGLYAAGETVGGVFGGNAPEGSGNAWAFTSGKLAADAIYQAIQPQSTAAASTAASTADSH